MQSSQEAQLNKQRKRPFVEIPQSMRLELLEEAHQIVTKTLESKNLLLYSKCAYVYYYIIITV